MKILITGSKGFVGTNLSRLLSKKNEVIEYDIKNGRDIFDTKLLNSNLKNVEVVIHLAAYVSGNESWEKPLDYFMNNGIGTFKVIEAAIKNKVKRIIIFSSAAVYGKPLTPYGASKVFAEAISNSYKDRIETIVLRPFNIYGKGQNPAYGYAIHNFYKGIKNDGEIEIYGDGNQTRDFVYIDDVVKIVEIMLTARVPAQPVDVGTGKEVKILNLAEYIGKVADKPYKIKFLEPRNEIIRSKASTIELKRLGIDARIFQPLRNGLKMTLT
ncbi:MAG: NAD-dependent epimerase/dehydratase [Candidatus Woesebacteria bacterium GW2011_GWB1_39_10]|uniref:NAD-dependent epimerase/dehydratase n=2 Tax=Candidatus Woeseibacteriota TaxID=1752722 RepID=A0A0G0P165_9BACT|nr:MAG: NAD-dependent epimerase/dehydratase [Candidatus Woesebacteria bacterium GW2011_GWB1_39_10]KKS90829.1 MAG: NAD-dependent epimerase/dehydratase [Candidatus Woesebacteria bacterium GW2011_GWA1_43_12]